MVPSGMRMHACPVRTAPVLKFDGSRIGSIFFVVYVG